MALLSSSFWTCRLQNCETTHFFCFKPHGMVLTNWIPVSSSWREAEFPDPLSICYLKRLSHLLLSSMDNKLLEGKYHILLIFSLFHSPYLPLDLTCVSVGYEICGFKYWGGKIIVFSIINIILFLSSHPTGVHVVLSGVSQTMLFSLSVFLVIAKFCREFMK